MKLLTGLILITCFLAMPAAADDYAASSELQTLFTSPEERRQLDQMRAAGDFKHGGKPVADVADKPVFREPLKVEMRGVVIRENEKPVVFVNKGNTLESTAIEDGIRVKPDRIKSAEDKVPVTIYNRRYRMKPGEVWTETDNRVQDSYQIK